MADHFSLQTLASRILAAALSECLPGLTILAVEEAFGGFYCDFSFSQPFSSEILVQLEERIRQIVREKREIRRMEMVPFSASEWLKKTGQMERAAQVLDQDGYVTLVQMGSFVDWCENPCGRHTGEARIIRLLEKKILERKCYRIFGIAAPSKEELKQRIFSWKQFPEIDHDNRGIDRGYWEMIDGERIWLAPGLDVRRKLSNHWREFFSPIALEVEGGENKERLISEKRGKIPIMQFLDTAEKTAQVRGLLDASHSLTLQVNSFGDIERDCISFLQNAHKSLTILGFTFRIRHFGKKRKEGTLERALGQLGWKVGREESSGELRTEFLVRDALQCEWVVAAVHEQRQKRTIRLTVWVERNLALLLEKDNKRPVFGVANQSAQPRALNENDTAVIAGELIEN
jgi:hypothetical protein